VVLPGHNPASAVEPPDPWEQYSAVLTADLVAEGESDSSPGYDAEQQIYTARFRIDSLFHQQNGNVSAGDSITIRLPSPGDMGAPVRQESPAVPEFFRSQQRFYAALKYDSTSQYYYSSSPWAYLSFLRVTPEHHRFISRLPDRVQFSKQDAEGLARERFEAPEARLRIDILGGHIRGTEFTPTTDSSDPTARLTWRIVNSANPQQYLFVSVRDGTVLSLQ